MGEGKIESLWVIKTLPGSVRTNLFLLEPGFCSEKMC